MLQFPGSSSIISRSSPEHARENIVRSLDRLDTFKNDPDHSNSLPALGYSVKLLMRYAEDLQVVSLNGKLVSVESQDQQLFERFNEILKEFAKKDMSQLKKNQVQILHDIWSTVEQPQFQKYLRPDINHANFGQKSSSQNNHNNQINQKEMTNMNNRSFLEPKQQNDMNDKSQKGSSYSSSLDFKESQQIWLRLRKQYQQHNIDGAHQLAKEYVNLASSQNQTLQGDHKQLIQTIQLQFATMNSFYSEFEQTGWVFDKKEKGISLQYKIFEEEKQIAILIQAEVDLPVQHFIAIISEIDLMGEYVPFCYDSKQLKVISRNEKIGTSKIYIPLLTDRETYFYAAGYNRIATKNSIFLFSKTINTDKLYQEKYGFKVPEDSEYVRLEYKFFIIEYIPVSRQRAKIRLASKVDMKLNFLPQFILHKSARTFAFDYFKNILKKSDKFKGSAWEKKVAENPQIYKFYRDKIQEYFKEK